VNALSVNLLLRRNERCIGYLQVIQVGAWPTMRNRLFIEMERIQNVFSPFPFLRAVNVVINIFTLINLAAILFTSTIKPFRFKVQYRESEQRLLR
jgi:hypothetical protein